MKAGVTASVVLSIALMLATQTDAAEYSAAGFDRMLKSHVRNGQVDYPAFAKSKEFKAYVKSLAGVQTGGLGSQADQLAFWINAYNALAIQAVLDGLSPAGWIGKYRFFYGAKFRVGGMQTNLYDLEHKIILPFGEPRVHFALVCASASCPKLRGEAYEGDRLDPQLDEQAVAFINDPTRNRVDGDSKTLYLSKIFDWFADDFKAAGGSLPGYIAWYVKSPELKQDLETSEYEVEYLDYDWSLNGPKSD